MIRTASRPSRMMRVALVYAMLAVIAIVANIGSQDLIVRAYAGEFAQSISVVMGTVVGLLVKYVLDKRFIFQFQASNAVHDARIFFRYTVMGLATTAIFLAFEFGFYHFFGTKEMRYLGGVIGLVIGYLTKYILDKRYVFRRV